MQSASSLNHTDEGNSLCNEIFFSRLLAFLSFDELQKWQGMASGVSAQLPPLFFQKEAKKEHILSSLESH